VEALVQLGHPHGLGVAEYLQDHAVEDEEGLADGAEVLAA
jgi:hypothetical protein